ncbi:hypothetical protein [Vibrio ziniensis]|uniref:Uncharacterized protein n=1 Tax=Vibrio ziniensis TaxID=2711221 RepID=A0A6G7CPK2_9VIBR|nr:hypothetical protein [Vibrio ziniensis]QIH44035.1 hypothetical protein G5S32_18875 [Vibrio ziniensis]
MRAAFSGSFFATKSANGDNVATLKKFCGDSYKPAIGFLTIAAERWSGATKMVTTQKFYSSDDAIAFCEDKDLTLGKLNLYKPTEQITVCYINRKWGLTYILCKR